MRPSINRPVPVIGPETTFSDLAIGDLYVEACHAQTGTAFAPVRQKTSRYEYVEWSVWQDGRIGHLDANGIVNGPRYRVDWILRGVFPVLNREELTIR